VLNVGADTVEDRGDEDTFGDVDICGVDDSDGRAVS
jgi:hypothetical protein